jgi:hypothetical protein
MRLSCHPLMPTSRNSKSLLAGHLYNCFSIKTGSLIRPHEVSKLTLTGALSYDNNSTNR